MAYVPLTKIPQQFFDNLGNPLVGGTLYAYLAGTSTPTNMFSDDTGTVAGTSVVLDSRGEPTTFKLIWLNETINYKFILKDSTGSTIWTIDDISADDPTDASLVTYTPAGAGAVQTTVQTKLREFVSVKDFGAVGDGATDDTTAVANAINSSSGSIVTFPAGTYRITSTITVSAAETLLQGPGTVSIDINDNYCFSVTSKTSFEAYNLEFLGNAKAKGVVTISGTDTLRVDSCRVYDFYTATFCIPIRMTNMQNVSITNTNFEKIRAFPDGVIGNTNGVAAAIYGIDNLESAVIDGCTFRDINNYSGATKEFEDADAITLQVFLPASPEPVQNVTVKNCYFEDCGKRALKLNSSLQSTYYFMDCRIVSSWTSGSTASLVGMYSVVSHYGGALNVSNIVMRDGAVIYFVDGASGSTQKSVCISNCHYEPEAHTTVRGGFTRAIYYSGSTSGMTTVVTGNVIKNVWGCIDGARNLICSANEIEIISGGLIGIRVQEGYPVITGNSIVSAGTTGQGIELQDTTLSGYSIVGNFIVGFNDSVYLRPQASGVYGAVTNNTCKSFNRSSIFNLTTATFSQFNFTGDVTNTFCGSGAGYVVTTGTNNSILGRYNGNQGGLDIRTLSNYVVLSDGAGNPRLYHNGTTVVIPSLPTSSAGLPTGALWNDSGTIKVA